MSAASSRAGHGSRVPATSANLGPGFDCLGLALDLRDALTPRRCPAPHSSSRWSARVRPPCRSTARTWWCGDGHGVRRPGGGPARTAAALSNAVPHARGLGSSSAAIVGGLALARALVSDGDERLSDADLLVLANAMEGHPDNVAPALYGGFVISGQADGGCGACPRRSMPGSRRSSPCPPRASDRGRPRVAARAPHHLAAANSGRTALLVAALAGAPESLWRGTEDFLHQGFRRPAMAASLDLVDALRARGIAALVSGAGPTVLALVTDDAEAQARLPRPGAGRLGRVALLPVEPEAPADRLDLTEIRRPPEPASAVRVLHWRRAAVPRRWHPGGHSSPAHLPSSRSRLPRRAVVTRCRRAGTHTTEKPTAIPAGSALIRGKDLT